jgi:serine/arginine repetitive matrix protein 2
LGSDSRGPSPVPNGPPGTTSLSPRLPGYIPGMPRPMTPRDAASDSDDQLSRANSTTPRASSPITERPSYIHTPVSSVVSSSDPGLGMAKKDVDVSSSRPQSQKTSLYLTRSTNGRFTPTDDHNGNSFSKSPAALSSSVHGSRRRPASPLSESTYQPMAVSSRPGTPSNVTWNTTPIATLSQTGSHHRKGSLVSDNSQDMHEAGLPNSLDSTPSTTRSLCSPALPDSPLILETDQANAQENRPPSVMSPVDIGSPVVLQTRVLRSPTPTQNVPRLPTPASLTEFQFPKSNANSSHRSSKQNDPSSPFTLSATPLVLSPIANSSRSSLESAGSSYHSWDVGAQKDRGIGLFISDIEPQETAWHSVGIVDVSGSVPPGDYLDVERNSEDVIEHYAGLTKTDFIAIQEKLVGAAIAKAVMPSSRDRVPSLRRRRPSTSQSNYSINGYDINRVRPSLFLHTCTKLLVRWEVPLLKRRIQCH